MTLHDKYCLLNRENLTQPIQMLLSQKQQHFCEFLTSFLKFTLNFEHFQKTMILIAFVFPKLWTLKEVVGWMSKKSCFRGTLHRLHHKRAKTLFQFQQQHFWHIYWSLSNKKVSSKKCLVVICKILRLFFNKLAVDDKYYLLDRENLTQDIQMHLFQKQEFFSESFLHFWNLHKILNIFQKRWHS